MFDTCEELNGEAKRRSVAPAMIRTIMTAMIKDAPTALIVLDFPIGQGEKRSEQGLLIQ